MNGRKKMINELRFQLNSKEVKDHHDPVQLSASDANTILSLLLEQEKTSCNEEMFDKLLQLLADLEIDMPCEEMSGYTDYCEENCVYSCPQKECWLYFLKGEWKQTEEK